MIFEQPRKPDTLWNTPLRSGPGPVTRSSLERRATSWRLLGVVLVLLALGGSIAIGIIYAPDKIGNINWDTGRRAVEKDVAVGFAIGAGAFVSSLIIILPYFILSQILSGLAAVLPATARTNPPNE